MRYSAVLETGEEPPAFHIHLLASYRSPDPVRSATQSWSNRSPSVPMGECCFLCIVEFHFETIFGKLQLTFRCRMPCSGAQLLDQLQQVRLFASEGSRYSSPESPTPVDVQGTDIPTKSPIGNRVFVFCYYCKSIQVPRWVWRSPHLEDNRGLVTCPVLRKYNCPHCDHGGGAIAHTIHLRPKKRAAFSISFLKSECSKLRVFKKSHVSSISAPHGEFSVDRKATASFWCYTT